jgi:hypothetical protein
VLQFVYSQKKKKVKKENKQKMKKTQFKQASQKKVSEKHGIKRADGWMSGDAFGAQ